VTSLAGGWQEVGAGAYRRRYRSLDLNVGAVLGDDQVLLIDTRSCQTEAEELRGDLRALTSLPCRQVVNTHAWPRSRPTRRARPSSGRSSPHVAGPGPASEAGPSETTDPVDATRP
jgi:hypothetical protein